MVNEQVKVMDQCMGENFAIYHGDSTEVLKGIPDNSVGLSLFSPPFSQLFVYSNSERDLGNSKTDDEFYHHFQFIIQELYRVLMPGRSVAFHCMNIPAMKERDGYIGIKDFRGDLIRAFQAAGFIFHSEHCIWKDPLIEATRTKALGLMHKQLCKDSSMSRAGLPDYLIAMRKPGVNPNPVAHEDGLDTFAGEEPPMEGNLSHERWRRYASPVWMDIRMGNTLNVEAAREKEDERHICPLSLDIIERALELWSNPGDVVCSPFAGIGSEGVMSIRMDRRFVGVELKLSYYALACRNIQNAAATGKKQIGLFEEVVK